MNIHTKSFIQKKFTTNFDRINFDIKSKIKKVRHIPFINNHIIMIKLYTKINLILSLIKMI